jgi:hypothetical protein
MFASAAAGCVEGRRQRDRAGRGQTFGEHTRTFRFRQRSRCQRRTFRWKLRDEIFGVDPYKVAVTVWDKDNQFSMTVWQRIVTID